MLFERERRRRRTRAFAEVRVMRYHWYHGADRARGRLRGEQGEEKEMGRDGERGY